MANLQIFKKTAKYSGLADVYGTLTQGVRQRTLKILAKFSLERLFPVDNSPAIVKKEKPFQAFNSYIIRIFEKKVVPWTS